MNIDANLKPDWLFPLSCVEERRSCPERAAVCCLKGTEEMPHLITRDCHLDNGYNLGIIIQVQTSEDITRANNVTTKFTVAST